MLLYSEFFNVVYRHHEAAIAITLFVLAISGFILLTSSSDESKKSLVKAGSRYYRIAATTNFVLGATGSL